MKLVLAVVQTQDVEVCSDALTAAGFVCTRFLTQGGFLDSSNCTLMLGIDDVQVDEVLDILRGRAKRRVELIEGGTAMSMGMSPVRAPAMDVEVGGATVFVVPLDRLEKL